MDGVAGASTNSPCFMRVHIQCEIAHMPQEDTDFRKRRKTHQSEWSVVINRNIQKGSRRMKCTLVSGTGPHSGPCCLCVYWPASSLSGIRSVGLNVCVCVCLSVCLCLCLCFAQ